MTKPKGLLERLRDGTVVCAEGYMFELERRGYLQAGAFVPEVVLAQPEVVTRLHRDFVNAGSDVVLALTYYAHREKLRILGAEHLVDPMNEQALALARDVAAESGSLFAGNICNTNLYEPNDDSAAREIRAMFDEQVGWAVSAGVDFIVGETFSHLGEALLAVEAIRGAGVPSVITLAVHRDVETRDGVSPAEACRRIKDAGADVVGLNCARGPSTMLPILKEIADGVDGPLAALPVPYRTTSGEPTMQSLRDHACAPDEPRQAFPIGLDPFGCTRAEIADFAVQAHALGYRYLGVCCGAGPHHVRAMAEALGRTPAGSRYSPDMSKHFAFGSHPRLKKQNQSFADKL